MGTARPSTLAMPSCPALSSRRAIIFSLTSTPSTLAQRLARASVTCPDPHPRSTARVPGDGAASLRTRRTTSTSPGLLAAPWSQLAARRVQKRCWRAMFRAAPEAVSELPVTSSAG
jgi:hypothetical protein